MISGVGHRRVVIVLVRGPRGHLGYYQLIEGFFADMCSRTLRTDLLRRARPFARYEREPTKIAIAPLKRARAPSRDHALLDLQGVFGLPAV